MGWEENEDNENQRFSSIHFACKMKILVTGGAGFIGSHVVDAYINAGHDVVVIDDLSTGKESNVNKNAVFYKADITDAEALKNIFAKEKPEIVNHHAAHVDVQKSMEDPTHEILTNQIGTINLLNCAIEHRIKKIIFASSAAVYGNESVFSQENTICKPISLYGFSKLSCEEYIKYYNRRYKLPFTILRYPNVYGPRNKSGEKGVIQIFFKKMISNEETTIFGSGKQTRDFIFVKDVVEANKIPVSSKGENMILNISTGKQIEIETIYEMIKKITGYKKSAKKEKERQGEIFHSSLNPHHAEIHLSGWKAKTELLDGLQKTYEEMKNAQ